MGIVPRMSDATHLQVYRRFFAVLFSVVPGLNLLVAISGLVLWLLADVIELDWGIGIGVAAITFVTLGATWIFLGQRIQVWAAGKSTGLLAGLNAPFLLVDFAAMGWLLYHVLTTPGPGAEEEAEAALQIVQALSQLV